jgi:pimeloyl-ACP methyl ester carboxylesterase
VLVPGILGSVLERDGEDVWAFSPGAIWRGLISLGANVRDLQVVADDPLETDLDGVTATRLMPDIHLVPGLWKIDGYTTIRRTLQRRLDLVEGENWFELPYDWRRDNRAAAHRLAELAPGWLDTWRTRSGNRDAKLVLVAHSMGGLVSRYYLEVLGGWEQTRSLVTFGTPFRGSLNAVDFLANGFRRKIGPFGIDLSELLRSLPSVHQLLPIYPCIDDGSESLRRILEVDGLPAGVDVTKVESAKGFHDEIAAAVARNGGHGRYDIHPVVGIFQPTRLSARLSGGSLTTLTTYEGEDDGGDGTVPRVSATPIELSDHARESYVTQAHSTLQNVDHVLNHLMGILTRRPLGAYRSSPFEGFRLDLDDFVAPDEPLDVRVTTGGPTARAVVTVDDVDTGRNEVRTVELDHQGSGVATFPPLGPGVFRVTVSDEEAMVKPAADLVVVSDDASAERAIESMAGR